MAKIKEEIMPSLIEFGRFKPIMSMTKDNFKEMQQFFLMKIFADNPIGITAYQIQNNYHFPRSNVIRLLSDLLKHNYLDIDECIVDGRANKMYTLTNSGFNQLIELKEKWHERFTMMEELTSTYVTQAEKEYFINKIATIDSKGNKIDFLRNMQTKIEGKMMIIQKKQSILSEIGTQIGRIIESIENMNDCNRSDLDILFETLPGKYRSD